MSHLFAISDIHGNRPQTWEALQSLQQSKDDWVIICGDVSDGWAEDRFAQTLTLFTQKYSKVIWTPGNHELFSLNTENPKEKDSWKALRGVQRYERLVQRCRNLGVITPEDPYEKWKGPRSRPDKQFIPPTSSSFFRNLADESHDEEDLPPLYICPIFTLYDYSFKPTHVPDGQEVEWATEAGIHCTDEVALHPDPFKTKQEWCHNRVEITERRLQAITEDGSHTILASHFPLRYDTVICPYVPNFSIWCGTTLTEEWHKKYNAEAVVFGHTHNRGNMTIDGVQFHEVSLGYPNQYSAQNKISHYIRQILPHRASAEGCAIF